MPWISRNRPRKNSAIVPRVVPTLLPFRSATSSIPRSFRATMPMSSLLSMLAYRAGSVPLEHLADHRELAGPDDDVRPRRSACPQARRARVVLVEGHGQVVLAEEALVFGDPDQGGGLEGRVRDVDSSSGCVEQPGRTPIRAISATANNAMSEEPLFERGLLSARCSKATPEADSQPPVGSDSTTHLMIVQPIFYAEAGAVKATAEAASARPTHPGCEKVANSRRAEG